MSTAVDREPPETSASPAEWVSAREAARISGLPEKKIRRAAELGLLTVRRPPSTLGGMIRYGRASCEALAASLITEARGLPHFPTTTEPPR